jgi:hypothetical protein
VESCKGIGVKNERGIKMTVKDFIKTFCDDKTDVYIFDDWCVNEETIHYEGNTGELLRYHEEYEDLLNRNVEQVDVGRCALLFLVEKVDIGFKAKELIPIGETIAKGFEEGIKDDSKRSD